MSVFTETTPRSPNQEDQWQTPHGYARKLHFPWNGFGHGSRRLFESDEARPHWPAFERRLQEEWPRLFGLLVGLYGHHYDFFFHLEQLLSATAQSWIARPASLKRLDEERESDPLWYQSHGMMGGVLYVDLFSETIARLKDHIPYFKELGLTYLHLMPLFAAPAGNSDGGYAVSSYRAVNPSLGTMEELGELAPRSCARRASAWCSISSSTTPRTSMSGRRRAQAGDPEYQEYYFMFPDRTMPRCSTSARCARSSPTVRRGSFTWHADMRRWVWTTFNSFQWDLNYANPAGVSRHGR